MMPRVNNVQRTVALIYRLAYLRGAIEIVPKPANGGKNRWELEYELVSRQIDRVSPEIRKAAQVAIKLGMVH